MQHQDHLHVYRSALAALCLALAACAGGESGPQQGTPEWYWAAAADNVAVGDYAKADEQIEAAAKAEGPLKDKAVLWRAALLAGLAAGYDELADAYVEGQESNEKQSTEFQPAINEYRRQTRQCAIDLAESMGAVRKAAGEGDTLTLEFPLPPGSAAESPILQTVRTGRVPRSSGEAAESAALESQTLNRAVLHTAAALSGAEGDIDKLRAGLGAGSASVARADFETAMARRLLDTAMMFDREGLNEPKIRTFIFEMAQQWAEPHLESGDYEEWAKDFKFDVTNEQRDMEGKRRIKKQ